AAGIDPRREKLILTLALALVVAVALQLVGALLIAALLLLPAATARALARTPEAMAAWAVVVGAVAVVAGLWLSLLFDTPAGPSIVAAAAGLFGLSLIPFRARQIPVSDGGIPAGRQTRGTAWPIIATTRSSDGTSGARRIS